MSLMGERVRYMQARLQAATSLLRTNSVSSHENGSSPVEGRRAQSARRFFKYTMNIHDFSSIIYAYV